MPVSIRASTIGSGNITTPTYQVGDLLLYMCTAGYASMTVNGAGWTTITNSSPSWQYDNLGVAWKVATSLTEAMPSSSSNLVGLFAITGFDTTTPLNSVVSSSGSGAGDLTISTLAVTSGSLKISIAGGYSGGGNPWTTGSVNGVSAGNISAWGSYGVLFQGGGDSPTIVSNGYDRGGGSVRWATVRINPAPASGFFAMF